MPISKKILLLLIKLYQTTSPLRFLLYTTLGLSPHACRHHPSCSQYTQKAIIQYGTIHGLFLGVKRIVSCHPYTKPPTSLDIS